MIKIYRRPATEFTNVEFDKLSALITTCNQNVNTSMIMHNNKHVKSLSGHHNIPDIRNFPMEFYMSILKHPIIIYEVDNTFIGLLSFSHKIMIGRIYKARKNMKGLSSHIIIKPTITYLREMILVSRF